MNGRWKHNKEIDFEKWDALVNRNDEASIFSTYHYLKSTCPNWHAFIDESYTYGFPVGVTTKLGVKSIYPPFFHRYSEVIGDASKVDLDELKRSMLAEFSTGILHSKKDVFKELSSQDFIYQSLSKDNYKLKTQAKRMIKKFLESGLIIETNNERSIEVLNLVKQELSKKMDLYASSSSLALDNLITNSPENIVLKTIVLKDETELAGGLLALEFKNTVLYLKGTTTEKAKDNGGMYALMDYLIRLSVEENKEFDFGGSRVEGVRFFNTRFNAEDKTYFCYQWDNSPGWYKFLKRIDRWRKR
jgi:hypothetical protein